MQARRVARCGRFLLLAAAIAAACAAAGSAPARVDLQVTVCGVGNAATWTRAGRTGRTWLVLALDAATQCKTAQQWLTALSPRIVSGGGPNVRAFRLSSRSCVATRSTLVGACRTGGGGPGSVGILVIGDPSRNPARLPYVGLRTSFPVLGARPSTLGIPVPTGAGTGCSITAPVVNWSFRVPTGTLLRGNRWFVSSSEAVNASGCAAFQDVATMLADAAGSAAADTVSFDQRSWTSGSWSCVAAHDTAAPGGAAMISNVPIAGCARVTSGSLEQVVVYPNTESGTGLTVDETRALNSRILAIRDAVAVFGIAVPTLAAVTAEHLTGPPPSGTRTPGFAALGDLSVIRCEAAASAPGSAWTHGTQHGSTWEVATNAGYPCHLASALFLRAFLAGVLGDGGGTPPAANLDRYGWRCALHGTTQIAVCSFTATSSVLRDAIGKPLPTGLRVGVRAAYTGTDSGSALSRAILATL